MWRSTLSFNDLGAVSNVCKISIPGCGVGLRCWPGHDSFLSADGSTISCPACQTSSSAFSGSTIAGVAVGSYGAAVAFLVIFLVLFLLACASLSYTFYKLRSLGSASPIPLPQTMQRWWNRGGQGNSIRQAIALGADDSSTSSDLYKPLALREMQTQ